MTNMPQAQIVGDLLGTWRGNWPTNLRTALTPGAVALEADATVLPRSAAGSTLRVRRKIATCLQAEWQRWRARWTLD